MRERLAELLSTDPSYRVLSYMLGPNRILEWAHSVGAATDPVLAACVSPCPPLELRSTVADPTPQFFMYTGFVDLGLCLDAYARFGVPRLRPAVLDFACGCGRMTRFLNMLPDWESFGTDVNPDHVRWCRENLPRVDTRLNGTLPPLPFEDGRFEFVYSLSLFTHLTEHAASAWLEDIARVLRPQGIFVATTHENTTLDIIRDSPQHQAIFNLTAAATRQLRSSLPEAGYVFLPYPDSALRVAKAGAKYGNSFIHRDYVAKHWGRPPWRLLEYLPGGLRGWDMVVMQKATGRSMDKRHSPRRRSSPAPRRQAAAARAARAR